MRFVARAAAVWLALLLASSTFAAADTEKERADKLFEDGRRYLSAKEYALACIAFEQSQASDPAIGTQLNIALCYEAWGKTASAYRAYVEAERLAKLKFDDRARGARTKLAELASRVPRLRLELPEDTDPSLVIMFDNKELALEQIADDLLIDPGKHRVEARVAGAPPKATEIEIANGERKTLLIDLPVTATKVIVPVPSTPPRRAGRLYGGIALISLGVVAIGGASFIALGARQDYNDAVELCPQFVCSTRTAFDATQDARKRANYMTFVGVGGGVLAITGFVLVLTSRGDAVEQRPVSIVPVIGGDQIGLAIGGRL
ncbi:MAG: hypothetical protein H0T42_01205 [Deltaproteobacteria bacterium]|nr:hypothetical protein [Deltaproteobacteria bacterium]